MQSHPAWGAWIEILTAIFWSHIYSRRTPHGVRGLKFVYLYLFCILLLSHPAWGAWIEIPF